MNLNMDIQKKLLDIHKNKDISVDAITISDEMFKYSMIVVAVVIGLVIIGCIISVFNFKEYSSSLNKRKNNISKTINGYYKLDSNNTINLTNNKMKYTHIFLLRIEYLGHLLLQLILAPFLFFLWFCENVLTHLFGFLLIPIGIFLFYVTLSYLAMDSDTEKINKAKWFEIKQELKSHDIYDIKKFDVISIKENKVLNESNGTHSLNYDVVYKDSKGKEITQRFEGTILTKDIDYPSITHNYIPIPNEIKSAEYFKENEYIELQDWTLYIPQKYINVSTGIVDYNKIKYK